MRHAARFAIIGLATLLAMPFVTFGLYDVAAFQSRREGIEQILTSATPDERKPSESLKRLFRISMNNHTAAFAARVLVRDLPVPTNGKLGWHSTNILWWGLVALHMDEEEQVALLASRAYMGNRHYGFSAESLARFGRPLGALNQDEEATLVALSHAPSIYLKSPERLTGKKEWLLRKLKNGS